MINIYSKKYSTSFDDLWALWKLKQIRWKENYDTKLNKNDKCLQINQRRKESLGNSSLEEGAHATVEVEEPDNKLKEEYFKDLYS